MGIELSSNYNTLEMTKIQKNKGFLWRKGQFPTIIGGVMVAQCPDHCKKLYKMVKIGVKLSGKPAKPSYSISDSG